MKVRSGHFKRPSGQLFWEALWRRQERRLLSYHGEMRFFDRFALALILLHHFATFVPPPTYENLLA